MKKKKKKDLQSFWGEAVVNYEDLLSGNTAEISAQRDLTEDKRFYNERDQIKKGGSTQGYEF